MNTTQTTVYEAFLSLLDDAIRMAGTANRLAEILDVPSNLITRWKNRARIPRLDSIQPVVDYLGRGFTTIIQSEDAPPKAVQRAVEAQKELERLRREIFRLRNENAMQRGEIAALERQLSRLTPGPGDGPSKKAGAQENVRASTCSETTSRERENAEMTA